MYIGVENTMLGRNVYFLRMRKGISRKYFGDLVGMTHWEVLALESGELTDIFWRQMERISILFNMNSNFLLLQDLEELYRHRQVYFFSDAIELVPLPPGAEASDKPTSSSLAERFNLWV